MSNELGSEGAKIGVLDQGYVQFIEDWGSDERIIEAARMSTDKGFLGWGTKEAPGDEKLLTYLSERRHESPFEFGGLIVEIQAPIFVFREWHRHRTQSYNEMSARYVQMPNLHYVPSVSRIIASAAKSANKQASGTGALAYPTATSDLMILPDGRQVPITQESIAERARLLIGKEQESVYATYETLLSWGVSKEVARVNTPVARYSRMRAATCLRNWLAFLTLRKDRNAQWEIRQFADQVGRIIKLSFPRTWEIFSLGHSGSWEEDGLPFYDHQIAALEKKLAKMKLLRAEVEQ